MRQLLIIGLLLSSLSAFSQAPDTIRLYRMSENTIVANNAGVILKTKNSACIGLNSNGPGAVNVSIDNASYGTYTLAKFRDKTGNPFSLVSSTEAIKAFNATSATAPTVATVGTTMPTAATYITSVTVVTANDVEVLVENMTTAAPTVTYANVKIPMQPREQRRYYLRFDPTTGTYIPIASLVVDAVPGMVAITHYPKQ